MFEQILGERTFSRLIANYQLKYPLDLILIQNNRLIPGKVVVIMIHSLEKAFQGCTTQIIEEKVHPHVVDIIYDQ